MFDSYEPPYLEFGEKSQSYAVTIQINQLIIRICP